MRLLRNEQGFNLVELMITVVVFLFAITAASQIFTSLLTQFKQQSKIAETNIEGVVGLDIFRRDLGHAGYGLPWTMNGVNYAEAIDDGATVFVDTLFNDAVANPPRPFVSGQGTANTIGLNGSDVVVIKAVNVAMNDAAQKGTVIWKQNHDTLPNHITVWGAATEDLAMTDYVTVISPGPEPATSTNFNILRNGANFYTTRGNAACTFNLPPVPLPPGSPTCPFEPGEKENNNFVMYGLKSDDGTPPRMPFNRADFYVKRPAANMPTRCAPNTGILYKGTINHANGEHTELPLLDCVVYMMVDYWIDAVDNVTNLPPADGVIDWPPKRGISGGAAPDYVNLTADDIRTQLKEVRVYILAHEGQLDPRYDFSRNNTVKEMTVMELNAASGNSRTITIPDPTYGDLKTIVGSTFKNYRWKLYTLVVHPNEMR